MTRSLRLVAPVDESDTVAAPPVLAGELLDETAEIPIYQPLPAVPRPARRPAAADPRRDDLRRYGWLVGLLLAGLLTYGSVLVQAIAGPARWVLVALVIWTAISLPVALLLGRSIRLADTRGNRRRSR